MAHQTSFLPSFLPFFFPSSFPLFLSSSLSRVTVHGRGLLFTAQGEAAMAKKKGIGGGLGWVLVVGMRVDGWVKMEVELGVE